MKFLIDEDLSPKVAQQLRDAEGLDVVHVRDRNMLGDSDHVVLERAYLEDRILITANVKDFQRLARARELHPGIVFVLSGDLSRFEQLVLLRKILYLIQEELDAGRDMINRVMEIAANGERQFYALPLL